AEDGIRDFHVTGVQTCALPISRTGLPLRIANALTSRPPSRRCTRFMRFTRSRNLSISTGERTSDIAESTLDSNSVNPVVPRRKRSEERRVGKEGRAARARDEKK